MSYAQKKEIGGNRKVAIIFVAIIQLALGYAIVTGLAYSVIKKTAQDLKTFDVEEPPPPPEKPPPPPKDMPKVPPPPMTPPPLVRMNTTPPPIQVVESPYIPPVAPPVIAPPAPPPPPPEKPPPPPKDMPKVPPPPMTPPPLVRMNTTPPPIQVVESPYIPPVAPPVIAPPAPPPPPAPHKVQSAQSAKANLASYINDDDYPASAASAGQEGTTGFRLDIGADGRVSNCTITRSSGTPALDSTTCNIMRRRAKFTPARDSNGNATTDSVSASVVWRLQ